MSFNLITNFYWPFIQPLNIVSCEFFYILFIFISFIYYPSLSDLLDFYAIFIADVIKCIVLY